MTEQGKVHYLLVRGYEEFHDEDEWLGIYSTWENAIAAYEREHAAYLVVVTSQWTKLIRNLHLVEKNSTREMQSHLMDPQVLSMTESSRL